MHDDSESKRELAAVLALTLCGVYGKPKPERDMVLLWFGALQRFELDDIRAAFSRHVGDPDRGQFPPRPADIVRQIDGSNTGHAPLAWGKVINAAARVGAYSSVVFDDAAIHAAIGYLGGWPEICRCTTDELPFLQRRFEASYRAYRERRDFDYSPRLSGIHAIENGARGIPQTGAVMIGNPEKCRLVLEQGKEGGALQLTVHDDIPKDSGTLKAMGNVLGSNPLLRLVPSSKKDAA